MRQRVRRDALRSTVWAAAAPCGPTVAAGRSFEGGGHMTAAPVVGGRRYPAGQAAQAILTDWPRLSTFRIFSHALLTRSRRSTRMSMLRLRFRARLSPVNVTAANISRRTSSVHGYTRRSSDMLTVGKFEGKPAPLPCPANAARLACGQRGGALPAGGQRPDTPTPAHRDKSGTTRHVDPLLLRSG
jgi:hypothetical protein